MIKRIFYGLIQKILEKTLRLQKNEVSVFVFHEICNKDESIYPILYTSYESFEKFILDNKEKIISLKEASEYKNKDKKIVITFDDVFKSAYDNAFPLLIKNNIPFTLFICEELIDKDNYLSSEEITFLSKIDCCTIGYHNKHHIFTRTLSNSEFNNEINPNSLKDKFSIECKYYAYPYGSMLASKFFHSKKEISKYFNLSFSTINSSMSYKHLQNKKYFLPRITVSEELYFKNKK